MVLTAEQKCYLWLSAAEVTPGHVMHLMEDYGSVQEIWEAFGRENGPKFQHGTLKVLEKLHSHTAMDDLVGKLERKNVNLLFYDDPAYPEMLKNIQDPPYLLYYAGRLACLEKPMVAIVGTRRASSYGMEMAAMLSRGLCEADVCVVSGLARGIDEAAHVGALNAGGRTVGILGSGINVPYPPEHTQLLRKIAGGIGLIISEYPLDAGPLAFHFPHRNRIIAGLCQGVVLVEGPIKSGGMHTVNAALMQGRQVFAVPGRVGSFGSEGPHALLRDGARIVTSAQELLEDLDLADVALEKKKEKQQRIRLSHEQSRIISMLRVEPVGMQELSERLQMDPAQLMTELGTLEIMGVIRREAGNRFYLPLAARK